jgi:hypothetical protein
MYIVLSLIPKLEVVELKRYNNSKPLLLTSNILNSLAIALYYINNIFFSL